MAIRVIGVPFGVTAKEWSVLQQDLHDASSSMAVLSGLVVTATGATRTVQVASGRSVQAGTRFSSDAASTLSQLAVASAHPRIDVICAQVTWPPDDQTDVSDTAGAFVAVPGDELASPVAPDLTQIAGQLWQTPLAFVRVNTNGTIVVTDVRPGNVLAHVTLTINSSGLATITHNLGVVPAWVEATVLNSNWLATPVYSSRTTTTFQVAVRALSSGALVTSTSAEFIWKAEA